ncbi:protein phosphatase regulatory subunit Sds22 [Microbotryomycetes sp. JL221]|nr:protein phosphatase regulatory subunit Sds22 [Microbotryomycetes sp. JL221]
MSIEQHDRTVAGLACSFAPEAPIADPANYVHKLEQRVEATEALLQKLSLTTGIDLVSLADLGKNGNDQAFATAMNQLKQLNLATFVEQERLEVETLRQKRQREQREVDDATDGSTPSTSKESPGAGSTPSSDSVASPLTDRRDQQFEFGHARFSGPGSQPHFVTRIIEDYKLDPKKEMRVGTGPNSYIDELLTATQYEQKTFSYPLPPADLVLSLVNLFFDTINKSWPVLHRPSFERLLLAGTAATDATFRSLLFVMLAISARMSTDPRLTGVFASGALYCASCLDVAPHVPRPPSLFYLQASMLGITYLLGSEQSTRAWVATGIAQRHFIDVGAHFETSPTWKASPLVDQLRKRAFHALLSLDRQLSMGIGRPVFITQRDFHLDYPLSISDEALDAWTANPALGPPTEMIEGPVLNFEWNSRLSDIVCDLCTKLFSSKPLSTQETFTTADAIRTRALEWERDLPDCLKWSEEPAALADKAMLIIRAQLKSSLLSVKFLTIRTLVLHVARSKANMESLGPCFAVGRQSLGTLCRLVGTLLDSDIESLCFGWLPLAVSYALIIHFSIMRASKLSAPFLKQVAKEMHILLQVLRKSSSTVPEARWVYQSALRLLPLLNMWRAGEGVDYVQVLLKPGEFDGSAFDRAEVTGPTSIQRQLEEQISVRAAADISVDATPSTASSSFTAESLLRAQNGQLGGSTNLEDSLASSSLLTAGPSALSAMSDSFMRQIKPTSADPGHEAALQFGYGAAHTDQSETSNKNGMSQIEGLTPETLAILAQANVDVNSSDASSSFLPTAFSSTNAPTSHPNVQNQSVFSEPLPSDAMEKTWRDFLTMPLDEMPQDLLEGTGQFAFNDEAHPWFSDDYLQNLFHQSSA